MKAPTCGPGDSRVAHGTTSTLFIPEIAKSTITPKRFPLLIFFAFLEVDLISRFVGFGFAFDFDVSFNGRARGVVEPDLAWLPLVVAVFTKEGPVPPLARPKIL